MAITLKIAMLTDEDMIAAAKTAIEGALAEDKFTATNATTQQDIQDAVDTALSEAGITGVTATVGKPTINLATKEADGSITGNVAIVCGEINDSMAITLKIAQLTDEDMVAAAIEIVEKALVGFGATDATTQKDIQDAVDTALSEAEITDVIATVGKLTITSAAEDEAEYITVSVTIKCGDAKGNVDIELNIVTSEVAKAIEEVEKALKEFGATNATTEQEIQSEIDKALGNSTSVTATAKILTKVSASGDEPGSIKVKVTFACGTDSGDITLFIPTEKGPGGEVDIDQLTKTVTKPNT